MFTETVPISVERVGPAYVCVEEGHQLEWCPCINTAYPDEVGVWHTEDRRALLETLGNVDCEVLVQSSRRRRRVKVLWLVRASVEDGPKVLRDVLTWVLLAMLESDCDANFSRRGQGCLHVLVSCHCRNGE